MSVLSQFAAGGIKSVQRGTIVVGTGFLSVTATISSVNTSKAMVNFLGVSADGDSINAIPYLELTGPTQIRATRRNSPIYASTISYEVVEFY